MAGSADSLTSMLAPAQYDPARAAAQAFVRFDGGEKGYLTRHELRCAHIALLGHPPSLVRFCVARQHARLTHADSAWGACETFAGKDAQKY